MSNQPRMFPEEPYITFVGSIDQPGIQRLVAALTLASQEKVSRVHLMFHSVGGFAAEGVFLYNFFRALPFTLVIYNSSTVASAGVLAYLGAKERKTSARATFVLHRTRNSQQSATARQLQSIAEATVRDDRRAELILRDHVTLTDEQWGAIDYGDVCLLGEEAVAAGLAHNVAEFLPPVGTQIFNT